MIDRYGVEAVTGQRVLGYGLIRKIRAQENVLAIHREARRADNWAAWARANPDEAALLADLGKEVNDGG